MKTNIPLKTQSLKPHIKNYLFSLYVSKSFSVLWTKSGGHVKEFRKIYILTMTEQPYGNIIALGRSNEKDENRI